MSKSKLARLETMATKVAGEVGAPVRYLLVPPPVWDVAEWERAAKAQQEQLAATVLQMVQDSHEVPRPPEETARLRREMHERLQSRPPMDTTGWLRVGSHPSLRAGLLAAGAEWSRNWKIHNDAVSAHNGVSNETGNA